MKNPHSTQKPQNIRALAAKILTQVVHKGLSLTAAMESSKGTDLSQQDRAFLQELCFGVCRHYYQLQALADTLLNKPLKSKNGDLECLLLVGLYQLLELKTPPHAVLSETVNAARELNKAWAAEMVNAVLRRMQRDSETLLQTLGDNEEAKYNHPAWLIGKIKKQYPDDWEDILHANHMRPPLWLRVNQQKISREDYQKQLSQAGIKSNTCNAAPEGLVLEEAVPVTQLPGFKEGLFSVQDPAGQLAARLLDLQPGHRVLDACAAPGGKTTHILELEPKIDDLVAIDHDSDRLEKIRENCDRLGFKQGSVVKLITGDASEPESWWDGQLFDRILLDAPCSATGVIRRHPDIKLLRQPEDIGKLAEIQKALLDALWPLLKPNGMLLYATCSILKEENSNTIAEFLANHPEAEEVEIAPKEAFPTKHGWQLITGDEQKDGFYYAKLKKSPI